mmetsp:Transcript_6195/g.9664  ORF Transcript_6195/g.9664 Transcript_6195/m.9664 type:complete len:276 (-) Transcript_6195:190-1017(-)|eukprot:CAMPEP_0201732954 /NCGR_PEP_ID=MMETSP0593-20130828/30263_1 /ASSEMBLY_ACC=CAM_ASM_000672 /TAXON_ID=267983 /ORGANISM="Skeletonema japonicum, Strain CCMP2506" /LENGTH=275 /DNA_ID=CAMNT_0048226025 /DNA_START=83 /DNA_END=910 /DNA_ORIENTATION=+
MPKAKKRAPGEFAPTQFATCIENGLNIHAQTKPSASSNSSDKKNKKEASKSKGTKHNIVETPAAKETAAKRKLNQKYPRIECTNGAMEALQLCHSEFIKATSTALVALESSKLKNDKAADAATASSKKKVSFSATTKTVTYNEDHVVQCMKQMGFSNLVERAMKSLNTGSSKQSQTSNKVKQPKRQLKQPASKPQPSAQNKKRKRKSNPLDDAALLAEQERLLSESAKRVYHNHNQQQQQQQTQTQQKQTDEQSQAVAATSNDLGSSGDAGGALV